MNRVLFFVLFFIMIIIPLRANDSNFEFIDNFLINSLSGDLENSETEEENKNSIKLTDVQLITLQDKFNELNKITEVSNAKLINDYEKFLEENQKKLNVILAFHRFETFKEKENGIKGIYVNGYDFIRDSKMDSIKNILSTTVVNTLVLDVKTDNGHLMYQSTLEEALTLNNIRVKYDKEILNQFKNEYNVYLIGRVVAFQDPIFSKIFTDSAILDAKDDQPYSQNEQYFLDPSDDFAKQYILNIALEACELGFDEIQFDYIRYPDTNYSDLIFDQESTTESRVQNINYFLKTATLEINQKGCLVSADIFGIAINVKNDSGIGQYLETLTEQVNFISPMVYPSHYSSGSFGYKNPNDFPYEVITASLKQGLSRGVPEAKLRPFLQAFWHTNEEIRLNIKASEDLGLDWLLWNNSSRYDAEIFSKLNS